MENNEILAADFPRHSPITEGYEDFFNGLLKLVSGREIDPVLGRQIHDYVLDYVGKTPIAVPNYDSSTYVRNYIGRDESSGWEAIAMTWGKGNRTAVHSHPQFASYTITDGKFLIEIFETDGNGNLRLADAVVADSRQCFYAVGQNRDFNNHIHRLTCLSERGHSLHIYSDNALNGRKYRFE